MKLIKDNYLLELMWLYRKYWKLLKPEAEEQYHVVIRLLQNGYNFTAIPNSTHTSMLQKIRNKLSWLIPWMSDLIILLKDNKWILFLEMKREEKKLAKTSEEQKIWQELINLQPNSQYEICYWRQEAIETIERIQSY